MPDDRWLSSRKLRAIALGAAAVFIFAVASVIYLHPTLPRMQIGSAVPPAASPLSAGEVDILDYFFIRPSVGWAIDVRSNAPSLSADFWIFRTVDGAKHWTQQVRGKTTSFAYSQLEFFDSSNGFVALGTPNELYGTVDGGSHWSRVSLPARQVWQITFADSRHGWLLDAIGPDAGNHVYATNDGGDTWLALPDPPRDAGALTVRSAAEVWMDGNGGDAPHVYVSVDGGQSWQLRRVPFDQGTEEVGTQVTVPLCSFAVNLLPGAGVVAVGGCGQGGFRGQFTSFDLGGTWTSIPWPPPDQTGLQHMTFLDRYHWWTMTGGALWKTADGGWTWTYVGLQAGDWGDYIPHALDAEHAWAQLYQTPNVGATPAGSGQSARSGLAMTSDGGVHWVQVNVPHP